MGLDTVELIMAVEDTFQVDLPDEQLSDILTVGQLYDLVLSKLKGPDTKLCMTSAVFYRLRRSITQVLGIERQKITPSTPLSSLMPGKDRRRQWARLQDSIKLTLPELELPGWLMTAFLFAGIAIATGMGAHFKLSSGWALFLVIPGLVLSAALMKIFSFLATSFPRREVTIGDLVKDMLTFNHAKVAAELGRWSKDEVWESLCRLIVYQIGVSREEIKPESQFVKDLRLN